MNSKGNLRGVHRSYTKYEVSLIKAAYEQYSGKKGSGDWLETLSRELGRNKTNISRYAKEQGWTNSSLKDTELNNCVVCKNTTRNKYFCTKTCQKTTYPEKKAYNKMGSKAQRAKSSETMKKMWADPSSKLNSEENRQKASDRMSKQMVGRMKSQGENYSRTQKGWAEFDGGKRCYFRSSWELKYANYLEMLKKGKGIDDWTYEKDTFWFENIKKGVRSYTPDFRIYFKDGSHEYHEVKGWMDPKSKTKIKRFAKYYPEETLIIIDQAVMKARGLI